ncbi:hypothetical protein L1887_36896 [Cichorium endivia]|nr:hypothetical protein L1887_36896 [Cichorium endivia]
MEPLINLVNKLQAACTALGDFGEESSPLPTLWESLPTVVVVGGGQFTKTSPKVKEARRWIVTRRPLVLQLHRIELEDGREYAEFGHLPRKRFTDFAAVRKEICDETDRETGQTKQISSVPIYLSIYSPYEAFRIFRIHHSLGDRTSLLSVLLSLVLARSQIPTQPPRFPPLRIPIQGGLRPIAQGHGGGDTPLKAPAGAEFTPRRFIYRNVSLEDIKLIKNAMNLTINDVALGVTQAGLSLYLNRRYGDFLLSTF